ncbi:MAG: hypothetical protein LBQ36_02085, partial [Synergistaceae bacterium]|nr:hypothetical protein [Synergistaceae bacterium]
MDIVPALSAGFLMSLLKAEAILTANIIGSLAAGELILASGVLERLFRPVVPALSRRGIDGRIAAAMLIALGSP